MNHHVATSVDSAAHAFKTTGWVLRTLIWIVSAMSVDFCLGQSTDPILQRELLTRGLREKLRGLSSELQSLHRDDRKNTADAAVFTKGLTWALDYDHDFSPADIALLENAITRGQERIEILKRDPGWTNSRRGKLALGYRSHVDDSVQPYGLIVPRGYTPDRAWRLDVVLHGSTRPVGLSELRFISRFDAGDNSTAPAPDQEYFELHPLGRVENCYRWAGETDVFEAIEDVCRRFKIDRDRIVLRGMSMGASGTWHLGLKHPDRFVALGPYCGYVDTHRFSETPLANFVKVGELPVHQEQGLHILDSVDYAANAGVVPVIACMGEKDVFFQAHVIMGQAMEKEGLSLVNLISPGTGHVIDPVTHAEQMRRIEGFAHSGLNHQPESLRFVTWSLKYSKCHWLKLLKLEQHYSRAEIAARVDGSTVKVDQPKNVTQFQIDFSRFAHKPDRVQIGDQEISVPSAHTSKLASMRFQKQRTQWSLLEDSDETEEKAHVKRPGLQGPIDDAFTTRFLCVRGTGTPWNAAVHNYSHASLKRFAQEWRQYFRGDLPVKDDRDVTEEDVQTCHLILFGDPGSNAWIARTLPQLPVLWNKETLVVGKDTYPAENHLPALIAPNPDPKGAGKYVVLNSGHTFRETELAKLNYLLFPRWGDWAVLQIEPDRNADEFPSEKVLKAGYFNEDWQLK